ncbi:hemoglobin [Terrihabitans soli]|uniref:Hemoglobin n=1 Tax=Terrihabitans soli TaxID=708113 RepID=A0A6S6QLQ8_9HYPH|nr:globin family protein [Terrihabitans soli]BCJ92273.1 hemoglobin [Terrihabitans soli]
MDDSTVALVQTSFAKVKPIAPVAADLFYARLFETAPELRPLFPEDLAEQKRKLMAMLAAAVSGLSNIGEIAPAVSALAVRHAGYGVEPEHYVPVGASLLWTLEQGLGEDFTPEVREAWTETYTFLASFMIRAAEDAAPAGKARA